MFRILFFFLFLLTHTAYADGHRPVIHISRALHLNVKKEFMADITKQVKAKDNVWAPLHNGEYVRVTFEQVLNHSYDTSIYAKPLSNAGVNKKETATIEVYPVYTDQHGKKDELPRIATFPSIKHEGFYRILLNKLVAPTRTFDLKIIGDVGIDYIADPSFTVLGNFGGGGTTDGSTPYAYPILSGSTLYGMTELGGFSNEGIIYSIASTGGTLTDLHDFSGSTTDGANPYGALIISGTTLYGMAQLGGLYNEGIIFSIATTGGTLADLHDFSGLNDGAYPYGGAPILSGSTLYGMTPNGGVYGGGIIFSIATTGGPLADLHDFSGGGSDGLDPNYSLLLSGSTLYGMTQTGGAYGDGTIFSIANTGGTLTDLHNFSGGAADGINPNGGLILSAGTLYGMSPAGGATGMGMIFSIAATGGPLTDLHNFTGSATDGNEPQGTPVLSGSTLYGATYAGGANGGGMIFSMANTGGTLTDLYDFAASPTDGNSPIDTLFLASGTLYGMTLYGGNYGDGIIYSIATTGGALTDLHAFSGNSSTGSEPLGSLTIAGNTMYGMTYEGGTGGLGMIFSVATNGGSLTDLHDFTAGPGDGGEPKGSLTLVNNTLYGMTITGGAYGEGLIFSIATNGGALSDLHDFSGSSTDGAQPDGSLTYVYTSIFGVGQALFGMTNGGGAYGEGIIFGCAPDGTSFTDFHDFSGSSSDGAMPYYGSLVYDGTTLYGMTYAGGAHGEGIIFSLVPYGPLTDLHDFSGGSADGELSVGSLSLRGSTLFGMTINGGSSGKGIIFSMATTGGALTDLHNFSASTTDGGYPHGDLTISGINLYGMTYWGGTANDGLIFSMAITGGALTDLHDFTGSSTDGANPVGNLTLFSGNTLYGMTQSGGSSNNGIIFSYALPSSVTNNGLIHWWKLDEAPGATTVVDSIGGANATVVAPANLTTSGKYNNALASNAGGWASMIIPTDMLGQSTLTINAWIQRSAVSGIEQIGLEDDINELSIQWWSDGLAYVCLSGPNQGELCGTVTNNDTKWHMATLVFDGTQTGDANRLKSYIDGVQQTLSLSAGIPSSTTTEAGDVFDLGAVSDNQGDDTGTVDEVQIYANALTPGQVYELFEEHGQTHTGANF